MAQSRSSYLNTWGRIVLNLISKIAVTALCLIAVAGCTTTKNGTEAQTGTISGPGGKKATLQILKPGDIKRSVATQALGPNAISVPVQYGYKLHVPAVYHIGADGSYTEICQNNFSDRALRAVTLQDSQSNYAISDKMAGNGGFLKVEGFNIGFPYSKTRVDSFKTLMAIAPTGERAGDYIVNNLGSCLDTAKKNKPYIVVTGVAIADRAYTIDKEFIGGSAEISLFGFITLNTGIPEDEQIDGPSTGVTFAVLGDVYN